MKPSHLQGVKELIAELPPGQRPDNIEDNIMTWAFVGGTLDPTKTTPQNSLFFFATEPEKLMKMMPGLDDLSGEDQAQDRTASPASWAGAAGGRHRRREAAANGQARRRSHESDQPELQGHQVFDFVIVGEFPTGSRWEQSAVMNRKYLDNELDAYRGRTGKEHDARRKVHEPDLGPSAQHAGVRHTVGQDQRSR